jgi:hypothetical protein
MFSAGRVKFRASLDQKIGGQEPIFTLHFNDVQNVLLIGNILVKVLKILCSSRITTNLFKKRANKYC